MQRLLPPSSLTVTARPLQQSSSEFEHVTIVESPEVAFNPTVTNLVRFLDIYLGPAWAC